MARPPRGGFRSSDVRGTLGSLIKSTLAQAGVVRDVLERGAREGKSRLDEARADKRRHEALAELGEAMLALIRRGEIDLAELPEVRDVVADLDALDAAAPRGRRGAWGRDEHAGHDEHDPEGDWHAEAHDLGTLGDVALPASRSRFDARGDGTVASSRWAPPGPRSSDAPRVWRPPAAPASAGHHDRHAAPSGTATPAIPQLPTPIARKASRITFDDDDLADYMHPDDVPPKPSGDE